MTSRQVIQFLALGLIFIILPAGSWYYLNEGYNYRKALLDELDQNLGSIPDFSLPNQNGKIIDIEVTREKATILNFLSLSSDKQAYPLIEQLYRVQDQFDIRDDIAFLTFVESDSQDQLTEYFGNLRVKENKEQWQFLRGTNSELKTIANRVGLSNENELAVAIADREGVIRYVYDFKDKEAIKKLILHIAELMPRDKDKRELKN